MKMMIQTDAISSLARRGVWALGAAVAFASQAAEACPGCKQVTEGRGNVPLSGASIGFGLSIFFLLFVLASVLGGLGMMMYRSCKILAAREAALMDDPAGDPTGFPSGSRA